MGKSEENDDGSSSGDSEENVLRRKVVWLAEKNEVTDKGTEGSLSDEDNLIIKEEVDPLSPRCVQTELELKENVEVASESQSSETGLGLQNHENTGDQISATSLDQPLEYETDHVVVKKENERTDAGPSENENELPPISWLVGFEEMPTIKQEPVDNYESMEQDNINQNLDSTDSAVNSNSTEEVNGTFTTFESEIVHIKEEVENREDPENMIEDHLLLSKLKTALNEKLKQASVDVKAAQEEKMQVDKVKRATLALKAIQELQSDKKVLCKRCGATFPDESKLLHHRHIAHASSPFTCHVCDKSFKENVFLCRHVRKKHGERPYRCDLCFNQFFWQKELDAHLMYHAYGFKPYRCGVCGNGFAWKANLWEHMGAHSNQEPAFGCTSCDKKFWTSLALDAHSIKHTKRKGLKCEVCSKCFRHKSSLWVHRISHGEEYRTVCNFCGKRFFDAAKKDLHVSKLHNAVAVSTVPLIVLRAGTLLQGKVMIVPETKVGNGSKQVFILPKGSKGTVQQGVALKSLGKVVMKNTLPLKKKPPKHPSTKGNKKSYAEDFEVQNGDCTGDDDCKCKFCEIADNVMKKAQVDSGSGCKCEVCGKILSSYNSLVYHWNLHTGKKPFKCDLCDKALSSPLSLRNHKMLHSKGRHVRCNICSKAFATARGLRYHLGVHEGRKRFVCKVCGKSFTTTQNLRLHIYSHSGQLPYACKECDKTFKRHENLQKHMVIHFVPDVN